MSENGDGGGSTPSCSKQNLHTFFKEKNAECSEKLKNVFCGKIMINLFFLSKSYVETILNLLICISKKQKFVSSKKPLFAVREGRELDLYGHVFFDAFLHKDIFL